MTQSESHLAYSKHSENIFVSLAAVTEYCKLGGFKPQTFILVKFWRREVQNQGVGKVAPLWRP